jgi:glutaredoxin-dependent peroxiredoxin
MPLQKGEKAPDFTLYNTDKKEVNLKSLLNKKTVLVFYPGAFTGVCTKEMCAFRDILSKFNDLGVQVIGISVDAPAANKGFQTVHNLSFPLLSDFTREVAKKYGGIYENFGGVKGYTAAKRAVYVVDTDSTVLFVWITEDPVIEPDYDEVLKAAV